MALSNGRHSSKPKFHSFAGIPRYVMDHPDYQNRSGNAVKLLNEFAYQYRGDRPGNNGDLTAAWSIMKKRGWRSRTTLSKALNELLEWKLVVCTRQGVFTNPGGRCALYALAWLPIHECAGKGLEIKPTRGPFRQFSPLLINKKPGPDSGLGSAQKLDQGEAKIVNF